MPDYPIVDAKSLVPLHVIRSELTLDPGYLNHPECPYPAEIREILGLLAPNLTVLGEKTQETAKKSVFLGLHGDKWATLEKEANQLYDDLRNFSDKIGDNDISERMTYFRTATALLEKIVAINERAVGLKHIHDFQQTVLAVFEEELTPDQRTSVIERLKGVIDNTEVAE